MIIDRAIIDYPNQTGERVSFPVVNRTVLISDLESDVTPLPEPHHLLAWVWFPAFVAFTLMALPAIAQVSQDERIRALEAELEAIRAGAEAGQDVGTRIDALEQSLNELKVEMSLAQEAVRPRDPAIGTESVPAAGMQGAPNPLQDDKRYLTGDDLLDSSFPNSLPIPGSDNRFSIGGYVKLDFIQDLDYVGDPHEFSLATIPTDGSPEAALDGRTTLHAKETRINFDFRRTGESERDF